MGIKKTNKEIFAVGKRPSFYSLNNKYYKENMITFIKHKEKNVEVIDVNMIVKGNRKRVLITLKCQCGNIYKKTWDTIYGKKYILCNECIKKKRGLKKRGSKQKMFSFIESKGYKIINKNADYLRSEWIEVINYDGYRGYVNYNKLSQGRNMSIFNLKLNKNNYLYNINNYSKINGYGIEAIKLLENGKWTTQGIELRCSCGRLFQTSINSFQNSKFRCNNCALTLSKWARLIKEYLDSNDIKYIQEFRFNSCRDLLPLPFDFYLVDYKRLIEVDGEQHFYPISFSKNDESSLINFSKTKYHDKIKDDFCQENNIPLLRISYIDIKNNKYSQLINQFIKD